ncbi:MAG TPA: DegV family protein [Ilumatobacteraceae bacterium]|nr:DegV family protein [Ilumatobacteraceae bacterium]
MPVGQRETDEAMIGICTDSNSQLLGTIAERYAIEVVPITVTVGDHEYLEGVDLDADQVYELLRADPSASVSTSQPSPGQFAAAYESLVHRGCSEILSIHVTASMSGVLSSARLAARSVPVPVRLVDSGTASFGVSWCVWAAAEAVASGSSLDDAVRVVESLSPHIGSVFILGTSTAATGQRAEQYQVRPGRDDGVPVLTLHAGQFKVLSHADTSLDAVATMAAVVSGWGPRLKVGVSLADPSGEPLTVALETAVSRLKNVVEVVRYRIGPSIGVYSGLGAVGCFMCPVD